jgi:hypothetical protein
LPPLASSFYQPCDQFVAQIGGDRSPRLKANEFDSYGESLMAERFTSSPAYSIHAAARATVCAVGRADRWFRNVNRQRVNRVLSGLLFACVSIVLLTNETCTDIYGNYSPVATALFHILAGYPPGAFSYHVPLKAGLSTSFKPAIVGTDGSQTGTADLAGNFTSISLPPPGLFLITRLKDCSLDLITATSATDPGTITTHFEQTLHELASLQTTPDVFPHGCTSSLEGIGTRTGVWSGFTPGGVPVFAGVTQNGLYYLSNATSGKPTAITSMLYASGVIAADLNGDSINDLVVVNGNGPTSAFVSVLLGKSDGTFQANVDYPIGGDYSVSAVIDDVNGDGKMDIVAVSQDQQISVLLGKGDGTFQSATSFAAPTLPGYTSSSQTPIVSLVTADVNGDGKKDIICSNGLVLLGNGDGTFVGAPSPAFPYTNATSNEGPNLAAGDLNNDGKTDLVLGTGTAISTWIGNGDGTFTQGNSYASVNDTGYVTISDLDGDGNDDIYIGLANGGIFAGDDSNPGLGYVLMGNGDGTFQGAPIAPGAYTGNNLADLNGDSVPDLVTSGSAGGLTVSLNNGKGIFVPKSTVTAPSSFVINGYTFTGADKTSLSSFAIGDVNGDGKPDLVFVINNLNARNPGGLLVQYPYPVYFVALGNGDGTFQAAVPYAFPQIAPAADFDNSLTVTSLQIADFNKDGHADLIFVYNDIAGGTGVNPYLQGFVVLTGIGNGTFSTTSTLTSTYSSATAPTTALTDQITNVADLNGDGVPDLIVVAPSFSTATGAATQLQVFVSNGDGTFKAPSTINVAANVYGLPVLADFNGDGKDDLAFITEDTSSQAGFAIALGNGNGTFASATISNLNGGDAIRSAGLAAADFNGDGKSDLAFVDTQGYSGIFYGNGDGTFTSVPESGYIIPKDVINLSGGVPIVAVDLNKDGKPDIFAGNVVFLSQSEPTVVTTTATTTTLIASPTTAAAGVSVTFTATVAPSSGSGSPTGSVTFYDGTTALGTQALASGTAAYSTSSLAVGTHSITAQYSGDSNYATSTSSALSFIVTAVSSLLNTATALAATPTSGVSGVSISFSATITPASGSAVPTGSVDFYDGTTSLGTETLNSSGEATLSTSTLAVGTHSITAKYSGDTNFNASTSSAVTVTISALAPGFTISNGGPITISSPGATTGNTATITVTPAGGFTGQVTLTAALATSPANAVDPPTFSFGSTSPVTVTSGAASGMLTVSTTAVTTSALARPSLRRGVPWTGAGGAMLACILLFGIRGRRRRLSIFSLLVLLVLLAGSVSSCGGGGGNGGGSKSGTTPGNYTVTVTGTSGSLSQSTTVDLTVN